ncbi:hypothetical protein JCM11251_003821 [Rhodosporidiobolus azoricus]
MSEQAHIMTQKLNLLDLPRAVLNRIFREKEVVTIRNLALCKALLPYQLTGLYRDVILSTETQVQSFAAAVKSKPELLSNVEEFSPVLYLPPACEEVKGLRRAKHWRQQQEKLPAEPREPTWQTLRDLILAMPNLVHFCFACPSFLRHLVSQSFLDRDPFPNLQELMIVLAKTEVPIGLDDQEVLRRLPCSKLLRRFILYLQSGVDLPLPLLNAPFGGRTSLQPRSWDVRDFVIGGTGWGGPELRHLFSLFGNTLDSVDLTFTTVSPSFAHDCLFLPSSLTQMTLVVGYGCPSGCTGGRYPISCQPLLDLGTHFPHLKDLTIYGNMVAPSTLRSLAGLLELDYLAFGAHAEISAAEVLDFLLPSLPSLTGLDIFLCQGPDFPFALAKKRQPQLQVAHSKGKLPKVVWPPAFGPDDAVKLLKKASRAGVVVDGTIRCAIGICTHTDRHKNFCTSDGLSTPGKGSYAQGRLTIFAITSMICLST